MATFMLGTNNNPTPTIRPPFNWPNGIAKRNAANGVGREDSRVRSSVSTISISPLIQSSAQFIKGFVPPDYLIDGFLQRGFLYSATAPTGAGKTAVALLLAVDVALGLPFGDREIEKGRVLYFSGENSQDVKMRWIAMSETMKFDRTKIAVAARAVSPARRFFPASRKSFDQR
jgi:AAA domain